MRTGLALLLVILVAGQSRAGTGDLDPTFGSGGTTLATIGFGASGAAVLRQSTGKLVVAGTIGTPPDASGDVALLRFDAAGNPDPAFGTGGVATVDFAPRFASVTDAALAPDDAIVVVAVGSNLPYALLNPSLLVARFSADGTLDPTFGSGGRVVVPDLGLWMRTVAVQPDGAILLTGEQTLRFAAVRLDADGGLDPTFGAGGIASTSVCCGAAASALLPDGRILLAGTDQFDGLVMRLDAAGAVDASFGVGGTASFEFVPGDRSAASAIVVLGDGRIVVGGDAFLAPGPFAVNIHGLARLGPAGVLDASFGSGGTTATTAGFYGVFGDGGQGGGIALAVEPSGKLLAFGTGAFGLPFRRQFELLRFDPEGALDRTFGAGGRTLTRVLDVSFAGALLLQPDGRAVVAGAAVAPGAMFPDISWVIARYDTDCPALPDTDGDGLGDACDPCTGGPVPDRAALRVAKVLPPAGDDALQLSLRGRLAPGAPMDPLASGIRVAIEDATGASLLDAVVPPGSFDPALGLGWTANGSRFRYRNGPAVVPPVEGISAVALSQSADGVVRVAIKGKRGSYPFASAPLPLRARVVLGPPRGATGLCLEAGFAADGCTLGGSRLSCKR